VREYHLPPLSRSQQFLTAAQSPTPNHGSFPLAISSIPLWIAIVGSFLAFFLSKYHKQQLSHQADSGSLAEEVSATIRTAHAFGVQRTLGVLFNNHVELGHMVEAKMALVMGVGFSAVLFAVYGAYGLGATSP
jgi:ATP-binding cassette subfamily B (MDR/TAP) protein 1